MDRYHWPSQLDTTPQYPGAALVGAVTLYAELVLNKAVWRSAPIIRKAALQIRVMAKTASGGNIHRHLSHKRPAPGSESAGRRKVISRTRQWCMSH